MTIRVETVCHLRGLTDRHMQLVEAAKQSLLQRKPITLGPNIWVIVGISLNEQQETIHIRGVRVRPDPLPETQERLP
jgi:hypothetical protein